MLQVNQIHAHYTRFRRSWGCRGCG